MTTQESLCELEAWCQHDIERSTHELCRRVLCHFGSLASKLIHPRYTFIATKLIKRQTPKSGTAVQCWKRRWAPASFRFQHNPSVKRREFEDDHLLPSNKKHRAQGNVGLSWRLIQEAPPKRWCLYTDLHSVTSRKTRNFINTAVRTSNRA